MKKMTAITFKIFNGNVINYTSWESKIQPFCIAGLVFLLLLGVRVFSFLLHVNECKSIEKLSPRFFKETKTHNAILTPAALRPEAWYPKEQMAKGTPNVSYIVQLNQAIC